MPFLRKLLVLAVTSGVAKKAWDRYRGNTPEAASGEASRQRRDDERATREGRASASWRRDNDKPGRS